MNQNNKDSEKTLFSTPSYGIANFSEEETDEFSGSLGSYGQKYGGEKIFLLNSNKKSMSDIVAKLDCGKTSSVTSDREARDDLSDQHSGRQRTRTEDLGVSPKSNELLVKLDAKDKRRGSCMDS